MTTIGSNLIFIEEKLIQIIENLRIYLQETTEKSDDYVKVHNATCIYTTMLLFSVSGHRDTRDPFCFRKFINTDLGALIIDDKAVTEKHRYRLAAIPEIALNQIKEYETHLDWLMSHLIIDKNNHELVAAIHMTKNTEIPIKDQILPFFFLLERKKGVLKTISITKSVLYEQIGKLWIFPFNFGRHGISSRLRIHDNYLTNNGLTIEQIKAQLNHMDGQDHPFGKNAIISPIEFRKTFSRALQSLAENDHWQIIKSRRSFKRIPESTKSKWKHEKALLGVDLHPKLTHLTI